MANCEAYKGTEKSSCMENRVERAGEWMKKKNLIIGIGVLLPLLVVGCEKNQEQIKDIAEVPSQEEAPKSESPEKSDSKNDMVVDQTTNEGEEQSDDDPISNEELENQHNPDAEKVNTLTKQQYLDKLNLAKEETEQIRKSSKDDVTVELKKIEGDRFDVWDGLLNEVYDALQYQLPKNEFQVLEEKQLEWIRHRDQKAKEASLKYEGGTAELLEYVMVQNDLTEERCFELVRTYMK